MARAICTQCGEEFYWHGYRGARLADISSPCCHAPGKGKTGPRRPRPTLPQITVKAEHMDWQKKWQLLPQRTFRLLHGNLQASWAGPLYGDTYAPTDELVSGWRIFKNTQYRYLTERQLVRIQEEDWQRLLVKAQVQP